MVLGGIPAIAAYPFRMLDNILAVILLTQR